MILEEMEVIQGSDETPETFPYERAGSVVLLPEAQVSWRGSGASVASLDITPTYVPSRAEAGPNDHFLPRGGGHADSPVPP